METVEGGPSFGGDSPMRGSVAISHMRGSKSAKDVNGRIGLQNERVQSARDAGGHAKVPRSERNSPKPSEQPFTNMVDAGYPKATYGAFSSASRSSNVGTPGAVWVTLANANVGQEASYPHLSPMNPGFFTERGGGGGPSMPKNLIY